MLVIYLVRYLAKVKRVVCMQIVVITICKLDDKESEKGADE